jgi:probable phosphoglycerate mutase
VTTLILIRHGETDWIGERLAGRLAGIHLNEKGLRQAEEVARTLAPLAIDAFYSSPLERARETAEPAARAAGKNLRLMEQLQEVDFGELSGKTFKELRELPIWRQVHYEPSKVRYPGGESLLEVQQRAVSAVEEFFSLHPQGVVALFSHSDTIRLILCHFLRMPLDSYLKLAIDPASISLIYRSENHEKVLGVNLPPGTPIMLREK